MEILETLGLDITFFFQITIFLTTFLIIYFMTAKPYVQAQDKRLEKTELLMKKCEQTEKEVTELQEEYERKAKKAYAEFEKEFQKIKDEATKGQEIFLNQVRQETTSFVQEGEVALKKNYEEAQREIKEHIEALSQQVVERLK